jgi:hypothetical protein
LAAGFRRQHTCRYERGNRGGRDDHRHADPRLTRVADALLEIEDLTPFGFARFARVTAADYG